MNKLSILLLLLLFGANATQAQEHFCRIHDASEAPRAHVVDFETILIDIEINPHKKEVKGKVSLNFKAKRNKIDSLFIDGPHIQFHSILHNGKNVKFKSNSEGAWIYFKSPIQYPSEHDLVINYTAHPQKGMYFSGWDKPNDLSRRQIWTQGQGIDNRHWFPHYDQLNDKAITEVKVSFDKTFKVLSNGQLIHKVEKDSIATWHYVMPKKHSSYLVMLGIGDYEIDTIYSKSGVPVYLWYYPDQTHKKEPTYRHTEEMFNFFEDYLSVSYPWGSYAQIPVANFLYGAMENTSATVFSDIFYVDSISYLENNYVYVNAHEFAHQWFGDLITSYSTEGHWIHEGFATFFHLMWNGKVFGKQAEDLMRLDFIEIAFDASKNNLYPVTHSKAGSPRHYMKSALVLWMLKEEVGENQFKRVLKHFLEKHAYENVSSNDLLQAFHNELGVSLNWFWNQWIYQGGEPTIEVKALDEKELTLEISQKNDSSINTKRLNLEIWIEYKKGKKDTLRVNLENDTIISLSANKKQVKSIIVDPDRNLLSKIKYTNFDNDWLIETALNGINLLDRLLALETLGESTQTTKKNILSGIQKANTKEELELWLKLYKQNNTLCDDAKLKATMLGKPGNAKLAYLNSCEVYTKNEIQTLLQDSSLAVLLKTLELMHHNLEIDEQLDLIKQHEIHFSQNERLAIEVLLIKFIIYSEKQPSKAAEALKMLEDYSSERYSFLTRLIALNKLVSLGYINSTILDCYNDFLSSFNRRAKAQAIAQLNNYKNNSKIKTLFISELSSINKDLKPLKDFFEINE